MPGLFRFADPWLLALLLVPPLVLWASLARRRGALRHSAVSLVRGADPRSGAWVVRVPAVLRALALALLVIALARPQTGISSESVRTEGVDIVMAMDVSSSMLAEDLEPNRIEASKAVAADFVAGRGDDRVGLVAFAGQAFTQAPLTLDHGVVQRLMAELDVGMIDDGTAVGMGLATAVKRLQASDAESKVVVLLTDGRNNRGEIGPITAAQMAEALGMRVYTIGVGTRGTARIPVDDSLVGRRYVRARADVDEPTLQAIAERTGGRFFRATDNRSLDSIYAEIDELETSEIEVENFTQYSERFPLFVGLGLLLVVLEVGLSHTVLRRLP